MPVYTKNTFDFSPALIDNNQKISGAPAALQPDGDEFGNVIDAGWTQSVSGSVTLTEAGGTFTFNKTALNATNGIIERLVTYYGSTFDLCVDWNPTCAADETASGNLWFTCFNAAATKYVRLQYSARETAANHNLYVRKNEGGGDSILATVAIGIQASVKCRIKRTAINNFSFYYDIGAGWVLVGSWAIAINDNLTPYIQATTSAAVSVTFDPVATRYYQKTDDGIAAQRFWNDSPESYIINGVGDQYTFDAGVGKTWDLSAASCTKSEPGTSTVLFKVGWSNTGLTADVTWVDGAWRTIAQASANAAAGLYDGHRYIHVKFQEYSAGVDQPTLTDFSITGDPIGGSTGAEMMMQLVA